MKRWALHPQNPHISEKLGAMLGVSALIGQLLLNRNIRSLEDAQVFLATPSPSHQFQDDILVKACALLENCLIEKKKILLYGDYDVDGMTSTSVMLLALRQVGALVDYYIPYRFTEGYGLNASVLNTLTDRHISLLITLDCGITNKDDIDLIKAAGIQVMILDHHTLPDVLPQADVILNPQFFESGHPLNPLCTVGIAYKLIDYYFQHYHSNFSAAPFLDLVALGTIADVASLTGENRSMTFWGMRALSKRMRPGIDQLLSEANFKNTFLTPRDIGFTLAPRLNAAGRMSHAKWGVELLTAPDAQSASLIAQKLQHLNEQRQGVGQAIFSEAKEAAKEMPHRVITLAKQGWHAGIIGIICSRLTEAFLRPAVLIAIDDGIGRGSARSFGSVNIYAILKECSHFFESFGGHKQAAGFSILPENIPEFQSALIKVAQQAIDPQDLIPILTIDAPLSPDQMTLELFKEVEKCGPFGQGNPAPIFYTSELKPLDFRTVGDGSHLKVRFTDATGKRIIDAIGFGLGHQLEALYKDDLELAFHLDSNTWGGKTTLQLSLVDIK